MAAAGHKILVVDDDKTHRTLVSEGLFNHGYDCFTAQNGQEGLEMMQKERPDLVILDVEMPVLDGWGTLKKIRGVSATKDMPVLLLTGKDQTRDMGQALGLGATSYLIKPVRLNELLDRVESILGKAA